MCHRKVTQSVFCAHYEFEMMNLFMHTQVMRAVLKQGKKSRTLDEGDSLI